MPAPMNPVEMLDWLQCHELLQVEQVNELRSLLPNFPDARLLAKELIRRNWLTPFEVNQILTDKGDQLILGCYRLRERLGEGAMGQVFKAWNTRLQAVVAVKTLHKDLVANARAMDRFRQEIEAAGQLDHPNIVKVRDADEIDSRPFLVMDYIEGANLSFRVKTQGVLPIPMAAECARQAALGLQHAFEHGVVHRDVKPANLLLEMEPGNPDAGFRVKILDFGLARFDSERRYSTRLTQPGSTLGTVDYMAPEQAESARDADTRADIYALGCTLYFLLTGKPPFPGSSIAEKIGARLSGGPPSVRLARPEVSEGLDAVLQRMMARQPAQRYQTPAEVADALLPFTVAPPPIAAMPTLEIDPRIPLAAPVAATVGWAPLAEAIAPPYRDAGQNVTVVLPSGADAPMQPWSDPFRASDSQAPFADASMPTDAALAAPPTAHKNQRGPQAGLDRRLIVGLAAGGATFFFLLIGCGGCMLVKWFGGSGTHADSYPAGAELQISEAYLSSHDHVGDAERDPLPIGSRKNLIVKIRRVKFHGDVEIQLEGLPSGVTSSKTRLKSGSTAIEVPIMASFGIAPGESDIRIVATSKNLSVEKTLHLHVIHAR